METTLQSWKEKVKFFYKMFYQRSRKIYGWNGEKESYKSKNYKLCH